MVGQGRIELPTLGFSVLSFTFHTLSKDYNYLLTNSKLRLILPSNSFTRKHLISGQKWGESGERQTGKGGRNVSKMERHEL